MQDTLTQEQTQPQIANIPPMPGQPWPEQGGIYAGIMRGDDDTLFHLIVADGPNADVANLAWGPYKTVADCESKWDGLANTTALRAANEKHPILLLTLAAPDDGVHDDWYLPSQRELSLCWAVIPDKFERDDWYWSSTQCSSGGAWYQSFGHGYQYVYDEDGTGRVRAVRRLVIQ